MNGYCWLNFFTEDQHSHLKTVLPPYITLEQLLETIELYHNYTNILSYFRIIQINEYLIHIQLSPQPNSYNFNEAINSLIRQQKYFDHELPTHFLIIGALAIDSARECLTSTMHQEVHQTILLSRLDTAERNVANISPYYMEPDLRTLLQSRGIPTTSFTAAVHDHPAHKSIENFILYMTLRNYVCPSLTVAYMKSSKFLELSQGLLKKKNNQHTINKYNNKC